MIWGYRLVRFFLNIFTPLFNLSIFGILLFNPVLVVACALFAGHIVLDVNFTTYNDFRQLLYMLKLYEIAKLI